MPLDESMVVQRNNIEARQMRLNNIKMTQFIVPTKEATTEKICLSECIPFVDNTSALRKEQLLSQVVEKTKAELYKYHKELVNLMSIDSREP